EHQARDRFRGLVFALRVRERLPLRNAAVAVSDQSDEDVTFTRLLPAVVERTPARPGGEALHAVAMPSVELAQRVVDRVPIRLKIPARRAEEDRFHRGFTSSGATVGVASGGAPPGGAIQSSTAGSSRYPPTPDSVRAPSIFLVVIV